MRQGKGAEPADDFLDWMGIITMKPQPFTIPQQFMVGDIKIDTKARLDRTYLRLLLDAFVPYQEAMLAYLDKLMAKHDPQRVKDHLKEAEKQSKKKATEWEQTLHQLSQTDKSERKKITGRLLDLQNEESQLHRTQMELLEKVTLETRSQTILQKKRENILKLLQSRQAMLEEGTWEKIGGTDHMSSVFSIIGDDSYGFGFSNITLQSSPINDIFDWMTHHHPDVLPPVDPFPPSPAPKQASVAEKKEAPSQPTPEFLHVPDEITASIRTFLVIRRPGYTLLSLHDRSDDQKRAWLALLTRKRHDETMERVCDVIIELEPNKYMTIQNVQDPPATQPSPGPDVPS
jgi:hypothetical protein